MNDSTSNRSTPAAPTPEVAPPEVAPKATHYEPPRLERLGAWRGLTLQQTVPIGSGGFLSRRFPFF